MESVCAARGQKWASAGTDLQGERNVHRGEDYRVEQRSERLRLVAATPTLVRAELEGGRGFAGLLGAVVPESWPPEMLRDVRPLFARVHEDHPNWTGWLDWYAIRCDTPTPVLCGSLGFKGPPDALGTVEIGYSILPEHQRRGLGTEMVEMLARWACAQPAVRFIEAETALENRGSIRVLERNQFTLWASVLPRSAVRYRRACS
jgi:[ribosomal protein S5]-alanine N-acetyltransferase